LASTLNNLGAAQSRLRALASAAGSYRQAIEIQEQLVRAAPLQRSHRRDLAVSYNNLGLTQTRQSQFEDAKRCFQQALNLHEQLVTQNPRDIELCSSLGGVYNNLGIVQEELKEIDRAAESYRKAVEYQRAAQSRAGSVDRYRSFLSKHYYNYGRVLRRLNRADDAVGAALARKQLWPRDPERLFSVAEELALASRLLDAGQPHQTSAGKCADLAVDTLREAVAAGLTLPADLRGNESFAALGDHPGFIALVTQR
jgi:hypothetical protein